MNLYGSTAFGWTLKHQKRLSTGKLSSKIVLFFETSAMTHRMICTLFKKLHLMHVMAETFQRKKQSYKMKTKVDSWIEWPTYTFKDYQCQPKM